MKKLVGLGFSLGIISIAYVRQIHVVRPSIKTWRHK